MHLTHLLVIVLFLFCGTGGESLTRKSNRKDVALTDFSTGDEKLSTISHDYTISPRQLKEFERTLTTLYKRFFGPPPTKLTLRSSGASKTILTIGQAIRGNVKTIMKEFGVNVRPKAEKYNQKEINSQPLEFSVFYELLRMPLEISPIFQEIKNRMYRSMSKNNYVKLGYRSAKFSLANRSNDSTEWLVLAISRVSKDYVTKIYECLETNDIKRFDLKKALGKLLDSAPKTVCQTLHRRLERALPKNSKIPTYEYTELHAFICHAISADPRIDYRYCLVEMKKVEDCVNNGRVGTAIDYDRGKATGSSKDFLKMMKSLDNSCVNVTSTLGFSVKCKRSGRLLKNNEFSYVSDLLLGDLNKSHILRRMAREVYSIVKSSPIGAEATRELATVVSVRKNAKDNRSHLEKSGRKGVARSYGGMSKKLMDYQRQLSSMSLKTINNMNGVFSNVENMLVDSTSKASRRNVTSNKVTVKCFDLWLISLLDDYWYEDEDESDEKKEPSATTKKPQPTTSSSSSTTKSQPVEGQRRRREAGPTFSENLLTKWMDSMKYIGQSTSPHRPSTLIKLANSFLLATMFYECMAVLAAVMNGDATTPVAPNFSAENLFGDDWRSQGKNPSLPFDRQHH